MSMSTQTLMTAREFETLAGRLGPCELVRGEVITLSPGGLAHNRVVSNAFGLLRDWARQSGHGRAFTNETGLIVDRRPDTVRGADVVYYSYQRLPRNSGPEGFSDIPPELVVEVVGKGQGWREMVEKAGEYLRMGVDRVWVIDPSSRRVHVFRPDVEPLVLGPGSTVTDQDVLPDFHAKTDDLFTD
ncbi:MAG: Uma2 family endonuclease [Planctomycetes bacterium]|nr:Uma2 family endonuclease [Planctomycetota bacterium]